MKGPDHKLYEFQVKELRMFRHYKMMLRGDLLLSAKKKAIPRKGVTLLSHVTSNRTKRNSLKLCQWRIRLDIGKIFTELGVKQWNNMLRKMVKSLSLEVFKEHVDVALRNMVNGEDSSAGLIFGLLDSIILDIFFRP